MNEKYMKLALELASKGIGRVNPNPLVGAVIVKDGEIIGTGYHKRYGDLHAERVAINNCNNTKGATMYVTLEPCCHYGKTPPCTSAIIESGISKVIIASSDPNELVAGKGIEILKKAGVKVITGVLKEEADKLNEIFFHYIKTKTPFVTLKYAMTLDGKIATKIGESKWITGEKARKHTHTDRKKYSAIMVGSGTVIKDNPMLNCRIEEGFNPIRIVCDTNGSIPLDSNIVKSAKDIRTIILTSNICNKNKEHLKEYGCEVLTIKTKQNKIDLKEAMKVLGTKGIDSIIIEGGATLNWSVLESKIVNKIKCYIAPKIFGGINAKSAVEGIGVDFPNEAIKIENEVITKIGEDILIEGSVKYNVYRDC